MVILFKEISQCLMEFVRSVKEPSGEYMSPDKLPQSFYDIEVWGVWRKENQLNVEFSRLLLHSLAVLVPGIVKHDGHRHIPAFFPNLLQELLDLVCINIDHGVAGYDFLVEGVDAPKDIESVSAGSALEEKGLLAPHFAQESLKCEVGGIHKEESHLALIHLLHKDFEILHPYSLFLRVCLSGNGLELPAPVPKLVHDVSGQGPARTYAGDFLNEGGCLSRSLRGRLFKASVYIRELSLELAWPAWYGLYTENPLKPFFVIDIDPSLHGVATHTQLCGYLNAAQAWISHLCIDGKTTFFYCWNGRAICVVFKGCMCLFVIFDGEHCYIYKIRFIMLLLIYERRLPSFIGYAHFAQIIFALPITYLEYKEHRPLHPICIQHYYAILNKNLYIQYIWDMGYFLYQKKEFLKAFYHKVFQVYDVFL